MPAKRYGLTARDLADTHVSMNGRDLTLDVRDELPSLEGEPVPPGRLDLAPASITFLSFVDAANPACF
jgi:hypothetical protein